jgi:transcription antitermination factor NusG
MWFMRNWFALEVRTKHEHVVARSLVSKGIDSFLPVYKAQRFWKDRIHEIDEPLFSSYVFGRFDPADRLPILVTPGVISVVSYGRVPVVIDDWEIAAIQLIAESSIKAEPWPYTQVGNIVKIERGPLAGLTGILVCVKSLSRIIVSINLIQRSVAAEIDAAMIAPPGRISRQPGIAA